MKTICIIPARSGSKGLPGKNLKDVEGHPLVAWPISAARSSLHVDELILSTDSKEIEEVGSSYGATVPFLRPEELSGDHTTTEETLKYTLLEYEKLCGFQFDIAVFLSPTDFFRQANWIDEAILNLKASNIYESSFVVSKTHKNFWELDGNNNPVRFRDWMSLYSSRQTRRPSFREDTGLACASRADLWRNGKRIGDKVRWIETDSPVSFLDIHTEFDLELVRFAYRWLKSFRPELLPPTPERK